MGFNSAFEGLSTCSGCRDPFRNFQANRSSTDTRRRPVLGVGNRVVPVWISTFQFQFLLARENSTQCHVKIMCIRCQMWNVSCNTRAFALTLTYIIWRYFIQLTHHPLMLQSSGVKRTGCQFTLRGHRNKIIIIMEGARHSVGEFFYLCA